MLREAAFERGGTSSLRAATAVAVQGCTRGEREKKKKKREENLNLSANKLGVPFRLRKNKRGVWSRHPYRSRIDFQHLHYNLEKTQPSDILCL